MGMLEQLTTLPGTLASFEFRGSGELLAYNIKEPTLLDLDTLDLLAHMCAANMSIATMQARGWEKMTAMKGFYPVRQFTLVGFDWSVVVSGVRREVTKQAGEDDLPPFVGVVIANQKADYEAAFKALEETGELG